MTRRSAPPCRWWESARGFDVKQHYTDCFGPLSPLDGQSDELAEACWELAPAYCPFCGAPIDWCEEDEVAADDQADHDHRMGVRYGIRL